MIFQKIVKYFINLVFFITDGKVNKFTIDDIAFSCVEKGSYFGEIEIFKKTHRENCTKTIENCHFLTMKRELLNAENIIKFQDFFKILINNYREKEENYEKILLFINKIIETGNYLSSYNSNILSELKQKTLFTNKSEINKIYFSIGLMYYENKFNIKKEKLKISNFFIQKTETFALYRDNQELQKKFKDLDKENRVILSLI